MAELLHVVGVQVPEESPLFPLNKKKSADCHLSFSLSVSPVFLSPCDGRWPTRSFLPHPNNGLELQVFTFLRFLAAFELYYRNSSVMHKSPKEAQYFKKGLTLIFLFLFETNTSTKCPGDKNEQVLTLLLFRKKQALYAY